MGGEGPTILDNDERTDTGVGDGTGRDTGRGVRVEEPRAEVPMHRSNG